ncbi:hypothetical protein PQH03_28970 [Ralstonia insidiosa]|jgi:hypothetical protein|uniref:Uncharacterized protein n=1 Tax=Ralstonia insidiosa TaxID=190721 RepID=A0A192A802_9RALS|nr:MULTISPECIES: hypothetical protein [Ralstonia]KMW47649.1 hypothetical protein AC240_08910 [Ralstonia sp. MD27]ANJ76427.1 hypothetical protein A9Y76_27925 [Ralstonia insidiosa]MBA9869721.1 hypothetical protein [Ralstonia insidiosa]MBA9885005.1 hypothetical protein [Ralstonia pickettii]MBA9894773.1 hypothetical protein [Ralstonia pickettii]
MIDIQRPLSPVLASLLLKEFPHEELAALGCAISSADKAAAERFYIGLEEHRLDLRSSGGGETFCDAVLGYLEALLDPGTDLLKASGIELTASSKTRTWEQMTDIQRTALRREAAELYAVIEPIFNH